MQETTWEQVKKYLEANELDRQQRIVLLNYFNKEINAFPLEETIIVDASGVRLANGKSMTLEQREAFLQSAKSLASNSAFRVIADQILYMAIKKGVHDAENVDDVYFSKSAVYFVKHFKEWIETLDKIA